MLHEVVQLLLLRRAAQSLMRWIRGVHSNNAAVVVSLSGLVSCKGSSQYCWLQYIAVHVVVSSWANAIVMQVTGQVLCIARSDAWILIMAAVHWWQFSHAT